MEPDELTSEAVITVTNSLQKSRQVHELFVNIHVQNANWIGGTKNVLF